MSQPIPHYITIQLTDAELQLPTRDDEKPELELKGRIVSNLRIVSNNGDDVSRYTAEVSIARSDEERDHVGSVWLDGKRKALCATLFAGAESFDRIVAQLSGAPREQRLQLGMAGLSRTDEENGTLEWQGQGSNYGQLLLSGQLNARLF